MADWEKFWQIVDQEVPQEAIRQGNESIGIYGDYLEGQYVVQSLNQACRECGLDWRVDWSTVRTDTMAFDYRYFVSYMTGDLVIYSDKESIRRPGMGVGRCMCPKDRETGEIFSTPADHQIDTVMKTALTDFIKNASMRLGRYFGGELYFDERMAGVLGWEIASDRATRQQYDAGPEDLAAIRIKDTGWGRDNKFPGWTLEEIYEDPDGYGAMGWCAADEGRQGGFINKKMAQYFNMREAQKEEAEGIQGVPNGMSLEEFDESVTEQLVLVTIAGRRVDAQGLLTPAWTNHVQQLIAKHVGPDQLFGHNNHVINHLKSHYNVAKVMDLTGEKAAALVRYIESNGKDADPRWYAEPTAVEELFGPESVEDLLKKAAPHLPKDWQDKPLMWWKKLREQYSIGKMNAKQMAGARVVLLAIASGGMNMDDPSSDTYKMFLDQMQGIADDV